MRAHRPIRHQRLAQGVRRYFCRPSSHRHDVRKVAVQRGHTSHQRVPSVVSAQSKRIEFQVRRVVIRVVIARHPSTVDSVGLARPVMAKPILYNHPASIYVVRQIVAQRCVIREREIAVWHHDLVCLELGQSGRANLGIEQIARNHTGLSQYLALQLGRHRCIRIHDQYVEC